MIKLPSEITKKSFSKSNGSIITIDTPYNHSIFIKTYTLTQLYES